MYNLNYWGMHPVAHVSIKYKNTSVRIYEYIHIKKEVSLPHPVLVRVLLCTLYTTCCVLCACFYPCIGKTCTQQTDNAPSTDIATATPQIEQRPTLINTLGRTTKITQPSTLTYIQQEIILRST
jgi:hypothetical protein